METILIIEDDAAMLRGLKDNFEYEGYIVKTATDGERGLDAVFKIKPDLLILEDFAGKHLPQRSGEYLLEVVMRRYEKRSILVTSNRPVEDWGKLFHDVPVATAILDRLLHHCHIVPFAGRSHRWPGAAALLNPKADSAAPRETSR